MTSERVVLCEVSDHIATLTLNRPEALNAQNTQLFNDLIYYLRELDEDDDVRVIILTGAGRAFSAGADLKERQGMTLAEVFRQRRNVAMYFYHTMYYLVRKPVLCAVNGDAMGGGTEMTLACDLRYASEKARFGMKEIKWAFIVAAGGLQRMAAVAGLANAKELALTGRTIDAYEAERIGLVQKVFPHEKLMEGVREIALEIAENPPLAVIQTKRALDVGANQWMAIEFDKDASTAGFYTED